MTEEYLEDEEFYGRPSKSRRKREVHAITELGDKLMTIPDAQLNTLPYPLIIDAINECKKITKGNARKRQLQFIGKQLRKIDLDAVHQLIDRFDASSDAHATHFHLLEIWRDRLISEDQNVLSEIIEELPSIDLQHLRQLTRNAINEKTKHDKLRAKQVTEVLTPVQYRKLFQYLKSQFDFKG
ncbi:MAG: ribosome-associated protein [Candidatus Azotimanducaceae bacterium]|jgi:ribosome-associated protein